MFELPSLVLWFGVCSLLFCVVVLSCYQRIKSCAFIPNVTLQCKAGRRFMCFRRVATTPQSLFKPRYEPDMVTQA